MSGANVQRRLAAILAADVVGYSRLMGLDEAGTLAAVRKLQSEIIEPSITEHHGRLFKSMGDGFLVEFASVVNSVACAAAMQDAMSIWNGAIPEDRRLQLRIGIHLGDIIAEGGDVYGDGVNVAARIEGLSPPGGVAVSAMVYDNIGSRLDYSFEDVGEHQFKNIAKPIRVYRLATQSSTSRQSVNLKRTRPSIAVLPFTNMSGDAEQEYFSDGITEDIITELSRFRNLFVIARNSAFTYKGKAVNIVDVGRELDVGFVVEGSVRRLGGRVRITAQLIDAQNGNHIWAERYDRAFEDLFDVQDEVVAAIAASTEGRVAGEIAERLVSKHSSNVNAYEYVLRARQLLAVYDTESAKPILEKSLEIDPDYSQAYAWLCWIKMVDFFYDLNIETIKQAVSLGKKGIGLDPNDSQCHANLGLAYVFLQRFDLADIQTKRALELNPGDALAINARAQCLSRAGQAHEAIRKLDDMLKRDPFPPTWYWGNRATALLALEKYEEAIEAVARKNRTFWWDNYMRVVCYNYLGRTQQAEEEMTELLKERPGVTIREIMKTEPFKNPQDAQRLIDGLRMAGLPE